MWTLFIALWVSVPAHAGSSTEASSQSIGQGTVQVRVWSVHATKQGNGMDERLGRVAKHLKVLDYSGFELLQKDSSGIPVKGAKKFPVAGGRTVRVSILSQNEKRARVRVQVSSAKERCWTPLCPSGATAFSSLPVRGTRAGFLYCRSLRATDLDDHFPENHRR
jgi:hypothetical protein